MNENTKTVVLLAVAALAVLVVWSTHPSSPVDDGAETVGALLFPEFKPLAAASLEIVKYDEETGDVIPFDVAQVKGIWSIPSHDNYPADAKEHLGQAASSLMDLKILSVASENTGDHELYGVRDPSDKDLKPGTPGVGMKVVMKDIDGKTLVALIIGKQDGDQADVRFVRRVGQEPVYTVAVGTDKLSTKFDDWIEKDLLKLNALDISRLFIKDYSVDETRGTIIQRGEMTLGYDDAGEVKWKLLLDQLFGKGDKWEPVKMAPDEELNNEKLDALKTALDDLKIVDVARKPAGLSADLAADKSLLDNKDAMGPLMQRGFYPGALPGGKAAIYSNEGEIRCLMKDGVEYILRFGNLADSGKGVAAKTAKDKAKDKKKGDADDTDGSGVNRYIFVTTEFNPEVIPKPELQPLPKADEKKPEAKDAKKVDEKKPAADPKAERDGIEKENKRRQDEYDAKVAEGKKKVKELNTRFADWYYVISESVYKKIHVSRKDLIKKKEKKEGEKKEAALPAAAPGDATPDAFNQLKAEDLEKK
jgi:hypothetical protein